MQTQSNQDTEKSKTHLIISGFNPLEVRASLWSERILAIQKVTGHTLLESKTILDQLNSGRDVCISTDLHIVSVDLHFAKSRMKVRENTALSTLQQLAQAAKAAEPATVDPAAPAAPVATSAASGEVQIMLVLDQKRFKSHQSIQLIKELRRLFGAYLVDCKIAFDAMRDGKDLRLMVNEDKVRLARCALQEFGVLILSFYAPQATTPLRYTDFSGNLKTVNVFSIRNKDLDVAVDAIAAERAAAAAAAAAKKTTKNNGLGKKAQSSTPAPTRNVGQTSVPEVKTAMAVSDSRERVLAAIRRVAESHDSFTTDEVWAELVGIDINPNEFGGAMRTSAANKVCYPSPVTRRTKRRQGHSRRIIVWLSNIYKE